MCCCYHKPRYASFQMDNVLPAELPLEELTLFLSLPGTMLVTQSLLFGLPRAVTLSTTKILLSSSQVLQWTPSWIPVWS